MKTIVTVAVVVALGSPAWADMSGLVGNTVIGESPDGVVRKIQLQADGSYRITLSDGQASAGRWLEKDGKLCYDRRDPPPPAGAANPLCVDGFDGHKVGDRWEAPWRDGKSLKMSVEKGR